MELFFNVVSTEKVLEIVQSFGPLEPETIVLDDALDRVLAEPVTSPEDLPPFPRSTVDGYAVRARDTFGGSEQMPALLHIAGDIGMAEEAEFELGPGEAARIPTGGMLPRGADAVVMAEYSHALDGQTIEISKSLTPWENVIQPGEDVALGQTVIGKGAVLRAQELGLLAGLGIRNVPVFRRPRVAILSTGDELVSPGETPGAGQVRDINSVTLAALSRQAGALVFDLGLVRDDFEALKCKTTEGLESADMLLISGGSSVGARDFTLSVFRSLPDSEILVHGVSISPGKPTILARTGAKSVWGIPGHVASAMVVFMVFIRPMLNVLSGKPTTDDGPFGRISARLSRNLASAQGRDDFIRVRLARESDGWVAIPVLGKSGLISTLVEADGLVRIDRNTEGLYEGDEVQVLNLRH
ncbi:MAG: molybdopterin molybdotransferase MoeA [Deltaproteobacteria bacterium]|nr:molybdopterin molybdotransferase MoeA [Deltaproteobacteria bacterium]